MSVKVVWSLQKCKRFGKWFTSRLLHIANIARRSKHRLTCLNDFALFGGIFRRRPYSSIQDCSPGWFYALTNVLDRCCCNKWNLWFSNCFYYLPNVFVQFYHELWFLQDACIVLLQSVTSILYRNTIWKNKIIISFTHQQDFENLFVKVQTAHTQDFFFIIRIYPINIKVICVYRRLI